MFPIMDITPLLPRVLRWKKAFSRLGSLPEREIPLPSAVNQPKMGTLKRVVKEVERRNREHKDDSELWNHVKKVPWLGVAA